MTPKEALSAALTVERVTQDSPGRVITERVCLYTGLTEQELESFEPRPLPAEIRELLQFARGFQFGDTEVDFTGASTLADSEPDFSALYAPQLTKLLPLSIPLASDMVCTHWAVDVHPQTRAWGTVFLVSVDPCVVAVQAANLAEFIRQCTRPERHEGDLERLANQGIYEIKATNPDLLSVEEARSSADGELREFAATLTDNFRISDLRSQRVGSGFCWGVDELDSVDLGKRQPEVRRFGNTLLFAIEQLPPPKKPSLWRRLILALYGYRTAESFPGSSEKP